MTFRESLARIMFAYVCSDFANGANSDLTENNNERKNDVV